MYLSKLQEHERVKMLEYPGSGKIDLVLDTDAATEVDDPFAIAHALCSPERLNLLALYAAPFAMNERTKDPAVGMEMSYQEILKILHLSKKEDTVPVFRGSDRYLSDYESPVDSPAARDLIERARTYSSENPLYVAAIGAITNVASAILLAPEIVDRMVVVWLGVDDFFYTPNVYNAYQDVKSAQLIFDCGVPLIHMPCNYVSSHLITSMPELRACIGDSNALCDYLIESVGGYSKNHFAWGKQIWDVAVTGYLLDEDFASSGLVPSPIITDQLTYSFSPRRHLIRNVNSIKRDAIFQDVFDKLRKIK